MTQEDKQLISEYMGWNLTPLEESHCANFIISVSKTEPYHFDLNDAGLCVSRMVEKGDWAKFWKDTYNDYQGVPTSLNKYTAWLFNADNFFQAMAAWRKAA